MGSTKEINIKDCTYYFYYDIIDLKTFDSKNLKVDKKRTKILIFLILGMLQLKKLAMVMMLIVKIPYIYVLMMLVDILKKKDGHINI